MLAMLDQSIASRRVSQRRYWETHLEQVHELHRRYAQSPIGPCPHRTVGAE